MKKKSIQKLALKKKTLMSFKKMELTVVAVGGRTAASDCLGDCDYDTVPGVSCYIPCSWAC
jgi:hypothetical protein